MGIFSSIMDKIFHHSAAAAPATGGQTSASSSPASSGPSPASSGSSPATPSGGSAANVDVTSVLDGLAGKAGQKLDWRHSIVDLMKLLDLDSGLSSRKELAKELGYTGDTGDSATMNVWLHKQVMQKLAANGGKVPDELKH
jgi:hypothetical protein